MANVAKITWKREERERRGERGEGREEKERERANRRFRDHHLLCVPCLPEGHSSSHSTGSEPPEVNTPTHSILGNGGNSSVMF